MDDIKILHEIGRGDFGIILLCQNVNTENLFAMKKPIEPDNFDNEIIINSIIASHSTLYRQRGLFNYQGTICSAMDYMPGGTLDEFIKKKEFLQEPEIAEISHQILLQIKEIHNCGVIHRDIKPENIIMDDDHNWKLIDFGISKLNLETACGVGSEIIFNDDLGTVHFMAPEMFCNFSYTNAIDIWAFGALLKEMVTGERLFGNLRSLKVIEEIESKKKIEFYPPYTMSEELTHFIYSCLEPEPENRANIDNLLESKFIKKYCDKIKKCR